MREPRRYGDLGFYRTRKSQVFSIVYILFSVLIATFAIGNLSSVAADIVKEKKELERMKRFDIDRMLAEMDTDGSGNIDKNEYVIGMLLLMEDVDVKRVTMLKKQFDEHDADGSGYLDRDDLASCGKLENAKRQFMLKRLTGDATKQALEEAAKEHRQHFHQKKASKARAISAPPCFRPPIARATSTPGAVQLV